MCVYNHPEADRVGHCQRPSSKRNMFEIAVFRLLQDVHIHIYIYIRAHTHISAIDMNIAHIVGLYLGTMIL